MNTHIWVSRARVHHRLITLLTVLGPGFITAIADNDVGGIATFSLIGSKFGFSMMFVLLAITLTLAVTQEMGARLAIVGRQGLGDLIRERYGVRMSLGIFTLLLIANLGTIIVNLAGVKAALGLLGLPILPAMAVFVFLIFLFIAIGNYQVNQRIFLGVSLLYIVYIVSAFMARPNWDLALSSIFIPTNINFSPEYIYLAIALFGTTVTPWGQFFISSFLVDKKISLSHLSYEQIEVYLGALLTNGISFFVITAVAATLFVNGIVVDSAQSAALAIAPFVGKFATLLFGLGLLAAGFMGSVVVSLTTAYAFAEFFGYEGSLDIPYNRSNSFYRLFMVQIIIAILAVLLPFVSLFKVVVYAQVINALLLPLILIFVIKFCNDKELLGEYTNSKIYNLVGIISVVVIIAACIFLFIQTLLGLG